MIIPKPEFIYTTYILIRKVMSDLPSLNTTKNLYFIREYQLDEFKQKYYLND